MQVKNPQLKKQIIQAARKCFFEIGYKKTRIERIAKEGYTTTSNIYTYFSGKEELFNQVIGNTPFLIDTYIAQYYRQAIKTFDMKYEKVDIYNIFPNELLFNKEVSMNLYILLEGAEGTPYASYKEGLYEMLRDCTRMELGENIEPAIVNLISYSFVEKVLGVEPKVNIGREPAAGLTLAEVYCFHLSQKEKKIELEIFCWSYITPHGMTLFWRDYAAVIRGIDVSQYEYIVDCRKMPVIFENDILNELVSRYCETNFKSVKYVFNRSQITLAIVFKRLAQEVGDYSAEIIFED